MSVKKWVVLDTENDIYEEKLDVKGGVATVTKRRLYGGPRDGIDVIEVDNDLLRFTILLTRGMSIWRGNCGDIELKWDSPVHGPIHPKYVNYTEPNGAGWLGGFDEWLVRCGLQNNGSPEFDAQGRLIYSLHGRISNIPASYAEITFDEDTNEFTITGTVYESQVFSRHLKLQTTYKFRVGEPSFSCQDVVTNLSDQASGIQLLYHINTGQPFASPGARFVIPFEKIAPRTETAEANLAEWNLCGPESPGSNEVVFFFDPAADPTGHAEVLLINSNENRAINLKFNKKQLPYFSLWKSRLGNNDGYVTGIEPSVNFPNARSFEEKQGRVISLSSQESKTFELEFTFLMNETEVNTAEQRLKILQDNAAKETVSPQKMGWGP